MVNSAHKLKNFSAVVLLSTAFLATAAVVFAQTPTPKLPNKFCNTPGQPGCITMMTDTLGIGSTAPYQDVQGNVNISGETHLDPADTSDGTINQGTTTSVLKFGGILSGEGITSKRTAGGDQYGLDFYTNSTNRLSILNDGRIGIGTTTPAAGAQLDIYNISSDRLFSILSKSGYGSLYLSNKASAGDPAVCSAGEIYFNLVDQIFKGCTNANTWTALGGSGGGGLPLGTSGQTLRHDGAS